MCLVDPASGRLTLTEIDFEIRGVLPIVFERSYRSTNIWQSDIGQGWGHSLGVQLRRTEDGSGFVFRGIDGRRIPLPLSPGEPFAVNADERVSLAHVPQADVPWPEFQRLASGLFAVSAESGPTYLFDSGSFPVSVLCGLADRSSNLAVIEAGSRGLPARLRDPHGRILEFSRDERGMLRGISLRQRSGAGTVLLVEYAQDDSGDLIAVRDGAGLRRYAYDGAHRLVSHRDRFGYDCLSVYDESGRCTLTEGAAGVKRRTYRYELAERRTTITDSQGNTTSVEYDDRERVVREVDQEGGVSAFTYDAKGRLVQATDQLGHTTSVLFAGDGAPAGKVRPDGSSVAIVADESGEVVQVITSVGGITAYERDSLGRVVAASLIGKGRTEFSYDAAGNLSRVKSPFGKEVRLEWTPDRSRVSEFDEEGLVTEQELDEFGRVALLRDATGAETRYEYGVTGRIARITRGDGTSRSFTHDPEGRLIAWTDELGATTRWTYDLAGRCVEIVQPDGGRVRSEYDLENRLVAVIDPGGRRHEFVYTPKGRVAEATFPDARTLTFRHDRVGRILAMVHDDGSTIEVRRDDRGRIEAARYGDGSVKVAAHDTESRWISVRLGNHEIARTLTPEGKAVEERQDGFRVVREFGDAGELLAVTASDGRRVRYVYNSDGRVIRVDVIAGQWLDDEWQSVGAPRAHAFEYDRVGNLTRWTTPSGVAELRKYDLRRRLVEQTIVAGERTLLRRRYAYNAIGRVVGIDDSRRGRQRFTLDAMGRLTLAANESAERHFQWGRSGQRTGELRYGAPFRVQDAAGSTYSYDQRGRVVRRDGATGTQDFAWTPHGLLSEAMLAGGRVARFAYDPHDRLIARRIDGDLRRYCWDDETVWSIVDEGGSTTQFVHVPGMRAPIEQSVDGRNYSVHVNTIGTVLELVDDVGAIVWENTAEIWGEWAEPAATAVQCPIGFPGQIRDDATRLYYNRNRFYDPEIGRYLTPDPMGIFGGLDPYSYVRDPINLYDPMGLKCRGKNDDPTLYRGDSRPPDDICANGLVPTDPTANISLIAHVNGPPPASNWISTAYEGETAEKFARWAAQNHGGQPLVYVIDNPNCGLEVDCDPDILDWEKQYGPAGTEHEIAFNGGVPANRIVGYYHADDPTSFQACP